MKSSEEIKKELHEYIDNIEDEETLWMVHEEVAEYLSQSKQQEGELIEEQQKNLDEAIRQADAGEFITEEEYKKATARWRTK